MTTPEKAAFRTYPFIEREIDRQQRPDGSLLLRSRIPFEPSAETWPQVLARQARTQPDRAWLAQRRGPERQWEKLSYGAAKAAVDTITQALLDLGLPGRPVMVLSGNSLEHAILSMAAMQAGMPYAPVSPAYSLLTPTLEALQVMVDLLEPAIVFVQSGKPFERAINGLRLPADARFVCAEQVPTLPGLVAWSDWLKTPVTRAVDQAALALQPETVAKYLFTSGSTGQAKAVVITHQMLSNSVAMHQQVAKTPMRHAPMELLAWLPWSHVAGGSVQFGTLLASGGTMWLDDGKPVPGLFDETLRNLRDVSPTEFASVPLGYSMLADALEQDADLAAAFFRNLRYLVYAGARMPESVFERMQALAVRTVGQRIPFISAFGSTETSASVTVSHWSTESAECIGLPHPGVELKLIALDDERFEIRVRSRVNTPGYFKRPDATASAYDDEGFFIMGDAVRFIDPRRPEEGLAFAGRVSEEFKLQSGIFVRVGALRMEVIESAKGLLSDAVVAGADQPFITLLAWPNLKVCQQQSGMPQATAAQINRSAWMRDAVRTAMQSHNAASSASSRRIRRVLLLEAPPDMGAGEITDKGYINQRRVLALRAHEVARLYAPLPDDDVIEIA